MNRLQKSGLIYLYLLPAVVAGIGFGIGHTSCLVYLPVWVLNICLILLIISQFLKRSPATSEISSRGWAVAGTLLIFPWILFSVFAGMGPPPVTLTDWLATATEQEIRYTLLMAGGISALLGFALLNSKLRETYSTLGFAIISVAIPLFILNMAFWGYFLTGAFRLFSTLPAGKRPDWYAPVKLLFYVISVVEVTLIYSATIFFAIALRKSSMLSKRSSRWYLVMAIAGMALVVLPPSSPKPLATLSYLAAIPAIPFIMPYLLGIRLLRSNFNAA